MMPGMLPRVGQSQRCQRVFYNTGHGHLGWTLSAATAEIVAAKVEAANLPDKVTQAQTGLSRSVAGATKTIASDDDYRKAG